MLNKHLCPKTAPRANKANIIYWKNYRISVLQSQLIRLEQSDNNTFLDEPTQSIWFRNMPKQKYTFIDYVEYAQIKTSNLTLFIYPERENCYIVLNDKKLSLDNSENLLGTYKTLDGYDGGYYIGNGRRTPYHKPIELENGVCSKNGVAIIDDSKSLILKDNGELSLALDNHIDEYIFAYGDNYKAALKALYLVTGPVPLISKFAFGNWWSRYWAYTQEEYLELLNRFVEHQVPLTVATIDMDWHYSNDLDQQKQITALGRNTDYYGSNNGWTGYSWNTKLFPNYKKLLKQIHNMNLNITLNLHPADGVRWFENCYEKFAISMGQDPKLGKQIKFNFTDSNFINNYFKIIHKPYEHDGVDFWWIDWQQGTKSDLPGLDPLWALNHYHYLDHSKNHNRGLILSRYSGIGSHRYPVGFSGDSFITWNTLDFLPYFTSTATNAGYTYWSHDIGGHQGGIYDEELYIRFIQLGVFSPINRLHCSNSKVMSKEPWLYKNGTGYIAEEFLRLRHKMIPFLYSMSYRAHHFSEALIQPLYYEVKEESGYQYPNEYIFANDLFIIPITTPSEQGGYALTKGYLPKGRYIDIFTNDIYNLSEGKEISFYRSLDYIPVLMKEGAIVPLSLDAGNSIANSTHLEIITTTGNNEYTLFEDNDDVIVSKTVFINKNHKNRQTLSIITSDDQGIIPLNRVLDISYRDIKDAKVKVYEDGAAYPFTKLYRYNLTIQIKINPSHTYKIELAYQKDGLEELKNKLFKELTTIRQENFDKSDWAEEIVKMQNASEIIDFINNEEKLSSSQKNRLLEILINN